MARIRPLGDDELPAGYAALARGSQNNVLRVFAHNVPLWEAWNGFYKLIMKDGAVEMRLKELMRLRIAGLNECAV